MAAHLGLRIAASVLDRWHRAELPYFVAYCYARPFGTVYQSARTTDGAAFVRSLPARDPISLYLNGDVERAYHPWLRGELRRFADVTS
jgi:hypothetical protein